MKARPRLELTPGESAPTRQVRDVSWATKRAVYKAYGIPLLKRLAYTIDHLIPLELNGSNGMANLWPEPRKEARAKDVEEAFLRRLISAGQLSVEAAQHKILADWGPVEVVIEQSMRRHRARAKPPVEPGPQ